MDRSVHPTFLLNIEYVRCLKTKKKKYWMLWWCQKFDIKALGVLFLISYPCLNYFDSFICWFLVTEVIFEFATWSVKVIGIAEERIEILQLDHGGVFEFDDWHWEIHRKADAVAIAGRQSVLFDASLRHGGVSVIGRAAVKQSCFYPYVIY